MDQLEALQLYLEVVWSNVSGMLDIGLAEFHYKEAYRDSPLEMEACGVDGYFGVSLIANP